MARDPEALADLRESADRLSGLMDDLLTLAREDASGTVSTAPVDLAAVAREALELHPGPSALDMPDRTHVEADGDRAALLLAIGNLVGNARKHGPPGALVSVHVHREHGHAVVDVHDEGPGLSQADAAHAFDRFWRADPGRPGSGLGLAIVRAVAERHGGTVSVDGSMFSPAAPALRGISRSGCRTGSSRSLPAGDPDETPSSQTIPPPRRSARRRRRPRRDRRRGHRAAE